MPRRFVFADEAGDFEFSRKQNVSRYFILCSIVMDRCDIAHELLVLRRQLAWDGHPLRDYFHAAPDQQKTRDAVFTVLRNHQFQIQATIMEKSKAQPQVRKTKARFYQYGWFYHFKHGGIARTEHEHMITAASIGTKKERLSFIKSVDDVMRQMLPGGKWATHCCPSSTDPCLQAADYCAWALQRKWESAGKDVRSYDLIKDRITYEYDLWAHGMKHYY